MKGKKIVVHNLNNLPTIDYRSLTILQGDLKTLTEKDKLKLCKSIIKHGFFVPAFVWKFKDTMYILDATQRYYSLEALEENGYSIPPIPYVEIPAKDKKDASEKLLQITSRYGKINPETEFFKNFNIELDYMDEIEIPELDIAFDELDSKDIVEDKVPETPEESITQVGDLWVCGKHRVLCGDATKTEDVERLMDGKKAEMLFTSPPYTDIRNYGGNKNLEINSLVDFIPLFSSVVNYLVINLGVQRKDYEIVEYWQEYISKAKENNYTFLSWNVWNREEPRTLSQHKAFFPLCHEWIFVFGRKIKEMNATIKCKGAGNKTRGCFIPSKIKNKKNLNDNRVLREFTIKDYKKLGTVITTGVSFEGNHPAAFPLSLPSEYIKAMTQENDNICDPFLGSGTTLIAADQLNRICYGMEIEPKYIDIVCRRFFNLTGIDPVRESDGVKWSEIALL